MMTTISHWKKPFLSVLILFLSQFSFHTMANASEVYEPDSDMALVVVLGGFNTCSTVYHTPYMMDMYAPARELIIALKKRYRKVKWVVSCYTNSSKYLRFYTSLDPKHLNRGERKDLYKAVTNISRGAPKDIYLIGHSYGGWTSVDLAKDLARTFDIKMLVTLDSISVRDCSPKIFIISYLGSLKSIKTAPGCTRAPADLVQYHDRIKKRVDLWLNFYQTTYPKLRSSEIPAAHFNYWLNFSHLSRFLLPKAHMSMESLKSIWAKIYEHLQL